MADVRKGDVLNLEMGAAEVLKVEANNEGGMDVTLRLADSRDDLSRSVLRKGGPDERDEDVDTHYEDYEDDAESAERKAEVEAVEEGLIPAVAEDAGKYPQKAVEPGEESPLRDDHRYVGEDTNEDEEDSDA